MPVLSILTLARIADQAYHDYLEKYEHGWWGKSKIEGKHNFIMGIMQNATHYKFKHHLADLKFNDPATRLAARVKSGGNNAVGSYRTLLVLKLRDAFGMEPINEAELVGERWDDAHNEVITALEAMVQNERWVLNLGLEFTTFEDLRWLSHAIATPVADPRNLIKTIAANLPLTPKNYGQGVALDLIGFLAGERQSALGTLITTCAHILGKASAAETSLEDFVAQYESREAALADDPRMLATAKMAMDIITIDKSPRNDILPALKVDPFVPGALDYWYANVDGYEFGAGVEPDPAVVAEDEGPSSSPRSPRGPGQ